MKNIEEWLNNFKESWKTHNTKDILNLFSKDIEYRETPFIRLNNQQEIITEWKNIKSQQNISIETEIFSSMDNNHTVKWVLVYSDNKNKIKTFSGIYLIRLDGNNKCNYFLHCCEEKS